MVLSKGLNELLRDLSFFLKGETLTSFLVEFSSFSPSKSPLLPYECP
jgi:hypothetical protein